MYIHVVQADSIPTAAPVYTAAVSSFRPLAVNCDAPRDCAERRVSNVLKCLGLLFRTVSNQALQHHASESTPASFGLSKSGDTRPRLRSLGVLSPISSAGLSRASTRDCGVARYFEAADDPPCASERGPGDTLADREVVRSAKDDGSVTSGGRDVASWGSAVPAGLPAEDFVDANDGRSPRKMRSPSFVMG